MRFRLSPGNYQALDNVLVYLCHGEGDSRRDVAYDVYGPGQHFEVPAGVNGFWHSLHTNVEYGYAVHCTDAKSCFSVALFANGSDENWHP